MYVVSTNGIIGLIGSNYFESERIGKFQLNNWAAIGISASEARVGYQLGFRDRHDSEWPLGKGRAGQAGIAASGPRPRVAKYTYILTQPEGANKHLRSYARTSRSVRTQIAFVRFRTCYHRTIEPAGNCARQPMDSQWTSTPIITQLLPFLMTCRCKVDVLSTLWKLVSWVETCL